VSSLLRRLILRLFPAGTDQDPENQEEAVSESSAEEVFFRAGARAEALFVEDARNAGWVAERIPQDQKSFEDYRMHSGESLVKRGDFRLPRHLARIEVEVKCFAVKWYQNEPCFCVEWVQWKGHRNMIKELGLDDVVFAFYERDGETPIPSSLRMASLKYIEGCNRNPSKGMRKIYVKSFKGMLIPISLLRPGFAVIEILEKQATARKRS